MKSVLMSIQPKWVEKIASGEKTIEIRKTKPNQQTPFKAHIYCTNTPKYHHLYDLRPYNNGKIVLGCVQHNSQSLVADNFLNGKVIGEFVCDRIEFISPEWRYLDARCVDGAGYILGKSCLTSQQLLDYGQGKSLYAWHITALKIYDKPKELSEFTKYMSCKHYYDCCACHNWDRLNLKCIAMNNEVKRPPQSWCYVEV